MATTVLNEAGIDDRPPTTQVDTPEAFAREQLQQNEADVIQGLRELERAESVKWHVYRIGDPDPGRNGFLVTWGTAQLSQENLRDHFGSGNYRVRGHYPNGTFATQRDIPVAGDAPRRALAAQHASSAPAQTDVASILLIMDQRAATARAEKGAFWEKLALAIGPLVAPQLVAMLQPKTGGVTELVQGLAALKQLQPEPASGMKQMTEMIEFVRNLDGGHSRGPGEKGPWDALTELARGAGPHLGTALERLQMNAGKGGASIFSPPPSFAPAVARFPSPAIATGVGSALPAGVASDPTTPLPMDFPPPIISPTSPTTPRTSGDPADGTSAGQAIESDPMQLAHLKLLPFLRSQTEFLLVKAARNADADLYADLLLDNIPDGVAPEILHEFLAREDWWAMLQHFDARVSNYPGWFSQLRDSLLAALKPQPIERDDP